MYGSSNATVINPLVGGTAREEKGTWQQKEVKTQHSHPNASITFDPADAQDTFSHSPQGVTAPGWPVHQQTLGRGWG